MAMAPLKRLQIQPMFNLYIPFTTTRIQPHTTLSDSVSYRRRSVDREEEDLLLKKCIEQLGEGIWHRIPLLAGDLVKHNIRCAAKLIKHPKAKLREIESPYPAIIPGLPDDLALRCLAKISHGYHGLLETVSKRWRDVLRSTEYSSCKAKEGWCGDWLFILTEETKHQWIAYDPQADRWHPIPMIPRKHQCTWSDGFGCVCVHNRFLVIGGSYCRTDQIVTSETLTNYVFQFDPFTKKWSELASMKTPRAYFACTVISGKVYVAGGHNMSHPNGIALAEVYDPLSNKWEELPPMPNTQLVSVSLPYNENFYVIKEQEEQVRRRRNDTQIGRYSTDIFDPSKGSWQTQELKWPCSMFGDVAVQATEDGRLYGVVNVHCGENIVKTRDSEEGEWYVVAKVPYVGPPDNSQPLEAWHAQYGFASLGNELYIMGGRLFCDGEPHDSMPVLKLFSLDRTWIWDKASRKWRETKRMCRPSGGPILGFASLKEMST